ncbi:hypothetical protein AAHE18_01G036100 [Arachis hypogaea]
MPTPVSAARQCLTEEAARALDAAVTVARRRNHAQTTSLHAISALLTHPSATLRDACGRARRTIACDPSLQFRTLELSVGISLDRLPTTTSSKSSTSSSSFSAGDGPPVSNSLMAAIKRSQANQRRNPENFHFMILQQQQNQNNNQIIPQTTSTLKVEMKQFMLSILDDPIVSRVFGEAGFSSYDIKLALLQPPIVQQPNSNSFLYSRLNRPVFLYNVEAGGPIGPGLGLPLMGSDQNCRRILDVLVKKERRNPLLMGGNAKGALKGFMDFVEKGKMGILPNELSGLSAVCVEKEICEYVMGNKSEETMSFRLKEVGSMVEKCLGAGVVVSFGEVEVLVKDEVVNSVGFVVEQLSSLLRNHGGKVWLVGVAGNCEAYSKFLGLFPNVDRDWDLHLLTLTSSSSPSATSSSSFMGSFVPLGGFFSTPSEFRSSSSTLINHNNNNSPSSSSSSSSSSPSSTLLLSRCDTCNEKYEQEMAELLNKVGHGDSGGYPTSLLWLQRDQNKGAMDLVKINEDNTNLNGKIFGLQRKWNEICQHVHHKHETSPTTRFPFGTIKVPLSLNEIQYSNQIPQILNKQKLPFSSSSPFGSVAVNNEIIEQVPQVSWLSPSTKATVNNVTTDLGLGTMYNTSNAQEPNTPKVHDHKGNLQHLSDSVSVDFEAMNEGSTHQIAISKPCSAPNFEGKFNSIDFKSLHKVLIEKVGWQEEAIYAINRAISLCSPGKRHSSYIRADTWLAFFGPDRVGKRKIALAIAECLFGNRDNLISVDLSSLEGLYPSNSVFEFQSPYCHDSLKRKTVVDYIAGELGKKPNSVIFLENVDKADFLVQSSLLKAMRTGRFPYSLGREISINNSVFIVSSTVYNGYSHGFVSYEEGIKMFPEERILQAERCQMKLLVGNASENVEKIGTKSVKVELKKKVTSKASTFLNKRKLVQSRVTSKSQKLFKEASWSCFDLNMPLEESEECTSSNDCEGESEVENHESWLHEFCNQIDGKVVFKPFDFESLVEQVIKIIDMNFQRVFGSELVLEIDYDAMSQILAATWLSEKKNAMENWIESVLGRGFVEAKKKYQIEDKLVIKLVKCESNFVEEQDLGLFLPARILS